jgi:energy-coupling factor transporter ATP-binding protein EcfA2
VRLSGKNFQAWSDFELDISGLTILTGPSDTGKSALFRALKGVLRNELPAEWVRDGQDEPMEIAVETDGYRIAASRSRKGSVKYEVAPGVTDPTDKFAKLDGDIPPALKALRYGDVTVGTFDVDPLFGRQNSAQFLIDPETFKPAEVNAVLGAFGGTEKLERGKRRANLLKTQLDGEARALASQIRDAEERKAALLALQGEARSLQERLRAAEEDVRALEAQARWAQEAGKEIGDAGAVAGLKGLEDAWGETVELWNAALALESLPAMLGRIEELPGKLRAVEDELASAKAEMGRRLCPKCGKPLGHEC